MQSEVPPALVVAILAGNPQLRYTRKMIDAMHDGTIKAMLEDGEDNFDTLPLFNLKVFVIPRLYDCISPRIDKVPRSLPGVPDHILYPKDGWEDKEK